MSERVWTEERIRELVPEAKPSVDCVGDSIGSHWIVVENGGGISHIKPTDPFWRLLLQTREELETAHTAIQNIGTQLEESRAEVVRLRAALESMTTLLELAPIVGWPKGSPEEKVDSLFQEVIAKALKIGCEALTPKGDTDEC